MAMSQEQKDANKAVRRIRDRLYHQRYRALTNAERTAEAEIVERFAERIGAADEMYQALEADRTRALAEIDQQIAALQERRNSVKVDFGERLDMASKVRSAAYNDRIQATSAAEKAAREPYPDMSGSARWSAAAWGETEFAKAAVSREAAEVTS